MLFLNHTTNGRNPFCLIKNIAYTLLHTYRSQSKSPDEIVTNTRDARLTRLVVKLKCRCGHVWRLRPINIRMLTCFIFHGHCPKNYVVCNAVYNFHVIIYVTLLKKGISQTGSVKKAASPINYTALVPFLAVLI